jgi:magnesium transporter
MATPARPSLSFSARDTSPTISPRRSGDVEPLFPMLSSHEEEEMNFARGEYDDEALHHPPQPQHDLLDILANHHDPMLSPIMQSPNIADVQNDPMLGAIPIDERSESGGMGGLPTYQPNNYHYTFDFGHMENFGAEEKERMGIMSSSRGLSSASRIISRPTTSTADLRRRTSQLQQSNLQIPGDGAPLPELGTSELPNDPTDAPGPFLSRRQRKLSQSHHPPRRQGKLALFEGANTNGPVSLIPGISVMKSSSLPNDARFNPPFPSDTRSPLQISTSGHDRPYRFSFYSNALAATVHARSLAELPAEGQSFEDLFLGRSPHEGGPTSLPQPTKSQPNTPASFDAGLHTGGAKPKDAVLGNAAQKLTENSNGKPGPGQSLMHDIEANTWWLDVLCPTDEEMGMLSKVWSSVSNRTII